MAVHSNVAVGPVSAKHKQPGGILALCFDSKPLRRLFQNPNLARTRSSCLSRSGLDFDLPHLEMRQQAQRSEPTGDLTPEVYEAVMARWDTKAANTFNKHLSALNSFAAYARRQEWLTTDPGRRLERRKVTRARDKAIPRARLERLFTDDRHPLRERVLWRTLYETCARAEEILGLDVPDLDMEPPRPEPGTRRRGPRGLPAARRMFWRCTRLRLPWRGGERFGRWHPAPQHDGWREPAIGPGAMSMPVELQREEAGNGAGEGAGAPGDQRSPVRPR